MKQALEYNPRFMSPTWETGRFPPNYLVCELISGQAGGRNTSHPFKPTTRYPIHNYKPTTSGQSVDMYIKRHLHPQRQGRTIKLAMPAWLRPVITASHR